jgi:peptide/nickel transport system substrate-binding protein
MLRHAALLGIGVGGVALLPPSGVAAAWQEAGTEWVVGFPEDVSALDPNIGATTTPADAPAMLALYDRLINPIALYEGPGFVVYQGLATSYEVVDDTTWEIKLRDGVTWHNGDPFTADDVVYTFTEYMKPDSAWSFINNAIESVEAVDPLTVRFHTKGIQAALLDTLGGLAIMPKKYREEVGPEGANMAPIGTGAYTFVEWVPGERVVFEANPDFWGGEVSPQRLVFRPIPDPATRVSELLSGGVDIIAAPPIGQLNDIENDTNTELVEMEGARTIQYKINGSKPPFDDVRVRQAVNMAVDREGIIEGVLEGHATPLIGTFSEGWLGWDPALEPYPYDPEQAKALLAEAGYADGFTTDFNTTSGVYLADIQVAEAVAAQLAEVGITVNVIPSDATKLLEDQAAGNFEGFLITPWGQSFDPDEMLMTQYYDEPAHPDEQLNTLIEATRSTLDPAEREARLQELNRYIHEQALNLEIHSQSQFYGKRGDNDWQPYPAGSFSYSLPWDPAPEFWTEIEGTE